MYNLCLFLPADVGTASGGGMLVSDLNLLTLSKLSKVLDMSGGWKALAEGLGLSNLVPALQTRQQQRASPSKALLDNFEVSLR